jgi:molybdopterin-containing oxidoreductase family membrane subunit
MGAAVTLVIALGLVIFGLVGYSRQLSEGEIVTGLGDLGTRGGVPWGLYIAFEMWAVGMGFGAMILIGVIRLAGDRSSRMLVRALAVFAMSALFVGGWSIIADVGQPLRAIVNIMRYARPMSPFFGTFTIGLVAAYSAIIVYLYLDIRRDAALMAKRGGAWSGIPRLLAAGYKDTEAERERHRRVSRVLAVVLILIGIMAASTSGFVFGVQQGRPGWVGALQAPASVGLAAVTGIAIAVVLAGILRSTLSNRDRISDQLFLWLNRLLLVLSLLAVYFIVVEILTAGYEARETATNVRDAIVTGQYAWMFWLSNALFALGAIIALGQAVMKRATVSMTVLAAVAIMAAALLKRYLLVVPPLTEGRLLPYAAGSYTPTWVEYAVVIGLVALGIGFFVIVSKILPVIEISGTEEGGD